MSRKTFYRLGVERHTPLVQEQLQALRLQALTIAVFESEQGVDEIHVWLSDPLKGVLIEDVIKAQKLLGLISSVKIYIVESERSL